MKSELVVTEKQILKNLGFMVNVQHPHKLIISMLAVLGAVDSPMLQQAWNYMNDRSVFPRPPRAAAENVRSLTQRNPRSLVPRLRPRTPVFGPTSLCGTRPT